MLSVYPIHAFTDNYIWAIHDGHHCVVIDPGDASPVKSFLRQHSLKLAAIIVTHHHWDHTNGIADLMDNYPSTNVYGPKTISQVNQSVEEGEQFTLFNNQLTLNVMAVPGHTRDHLAYYNHEWLFCGDTLFSVGCGRMFEGTPEEFWNSLTKLRALADNTQVFCTHEYTLANIKFAQHIDANNDDLQIYSDWATKQRDAGQPTLPTTIGIQKKINPFLRCDDVVWTQSIRSTIELENSCAVGVFTAIRRAKDHF